MDWAAMLQRMYSRWAKSKEYTGMTTQRCVCTWSQKVCCCSVSRRQSDASCFPVTTVDEQPAEHGIRGAVLRIGGRNAFGWLHGETGIHRLVRMSPFDATVMFRCTLWHVLLRVSH